MPAGTVEVLYGQNVPNAEKLSGNWRGSTVGKFLPGIWRRQGEIVPDFHADTAQTKKPGLVVRG